MHRRKNTAEAFEIVSRVYEEERRRREEASAEGVAAAQGRPAGEPGTGAPGGGEKPADPALDRAVHPSADSSTDPSAVAAAGGAPAARGRPLVPREPLLKAPAASRKAPGETARRAPPPEASSAAPSGGARRRFSGGRQRGRAVWGEREPLESGDRVGADRLASSGSEARRWRAAPWMPPTAETCGPEAEREAGAAAEPELDGSVGELESGIGDEIAAGERVCRERVLYEGGEREALLARDAPDALQLDGRQLDGRAGPGGDPPEAAGARDSDRVIRSLEARDLPPRPRSSSAGRAGAWEPDSGSGLGGAVAGGGGGRSGGGPERSPPPLKQRGPSAPAEGSRGAGGRLERGVGEDPEAPGFAGPQARAGRHEPVARDRGDGQQDAPISQQEQEEQEEAPRIGFVRKAADWILGTEGISLLEKRVEVRVSTLLAAAMATVVLFFLALMYLGSPAPAPGYFEPVANPQEPPEGVAAGEPGAAGEPAVGGEGAPAEAERPGRSAVQSDLPPLVRFSPPSREAYPDLRNVVVKNEPAAETVAETVAEGQDGSISPPPKGPYHMIQVRANESLDGANKILDYFRDLGFDGHMESDARDIEGLRLYTVYVGRYATYAQARKEWERLKDVVRRAPYKRGYFADTLIITRKP